MQEKKLLLKPNSKLSKSNPLMDMKNEMTLTQLRMFNIYLGMINPMDEATKTVRFSLKSFAAAIRITEVNGKKLRKIGKDAMGITVDLRQIETGEDGRKHVLSEMKLRHLWESFDVAQDENGEWYVELEAHKSILPYMFEIKELGYAPMLLMMTLIMKSPIAEKLYEQCVRFRKKGCFTITVDQLKDRLGVSEKKSYTEYARFKDRVIKRALEEINEKTDIYVTVKENRAKTRGTPVQSIVFTVKDNPKFQNKSTAEMIESICADSKGNVVEEQMEPISMSLEKEQNPKEKDTKQLKERLQREYGLSDEEVEYVLQDQKKLDLTDDRVAEVVSYVAAKDTDNQIGYIRAMLRRPNAKLKIVPEEVKAKPQNKNQFNQFEQNQYDMDALEEELLDIRKNDYSENPDQDSEPDIEIDETVETKNENINIEAYREAKPCLPLYYIVIGRPDVMDRLAAYAAKGIPTNEIKILSEEEYNQMK